MWRIEGSDGRWLDFRGGRWDADTTTGAEVTGWLVDQVPAPMTPLGPQYDATGSNDQTWLYLAGRHLIPGPLTVTGTPPPVPVPPVAAGAAVVH